MTQKIQKLWKKIFRKNEDLYLLKVCAKHFGKVTRNKKVKGKKKPPKYKYTFIEIPSLIIQVLKNADINYANN